MSEPLDLLPDSATPLEIALSRADASQLLAPTEVIRTVKDPMRAPEALLPWLALEHRVTQTWSPDMTVDQKRQVIAAQYRILQHAGTPKGLADALAQLGVAAGYDEWFEYAGDPYFIRLRAGIDGATAWTAAIDAQVWRTVVAYKNRRTAVGDIALVRTMPQGGPRMAGVVMIEDAITFLVIVPDILPPPVALRLGAVMLIGETIVFGRAA